MAVGLGLLTGGNAAFGQATESPPNPAETQPADMGAQIAQWVVRLRDPALSAAERAEAAGRLWAAADGEDPRTAGSARDLIAEVLRAPDADAATRLAQVGAARVCIGAWAVGPLADAAMGSAEVGGNVEAVRALGSVRTREAAGALLQLAESSAELAPVAVRALARLTAHPAPPETAEGWRTAIGSVLEDERAWSSTMIGWLAADAERQRTDAAALGTRLLAALRKQFVSATATEDRSNLLAGWLGDPMPAVRALAVELSQRELVNARPLGPAVARAAVLLLARPEAAARRDGAVLLSALTVETPPVEEITAALRSETDAAAAATLLECAARWPDESQAETVLVWFARGDGPALAASERALWALVQNGWRPDAAARESVLEALHAREPATLGGPAVYLLAWLGDDADRRSLYRILLSDSAEPGLRATAGRALAPHEAWVGPLLDAAGRDPAVFDAACEAAALHAATPEVIARLSGAPGVSPERKAAGIERVAAGLDIGERVAAAAGAGTPLVRARLLAPLASANEPSADLVRGLVLLTEALLDLDDPAAAWATAQQANGAAEQLAGEEPPAKFDRERLSRVLLMAAVRAAQVDRLASIEAPLRAWMSAIDAAPNDAVAAAVASIAIGRFEGELDEPSSARLNEIVQRAAARENENGEDGTDPVPSNNDATPGPG